MSATPSKGLCLNVIGSPYTFLIGSNLPLIRASYAEGFDLTALDGFPPLKVAELDSPFPDLSLLLRATLAAPPMKCDELSS